MTIAPSTPTTIAGAFLDTVARRSDSVAVRTLGGEVTYTWAALAERVAVAAGALRARGVQPGDTVALLLTNRPELWVADLAVTMCGATTCPLYTTLPPNDVEYVVGDAGAKLIVTERALLPGTRDVTLPVLVIEDGALDAGEPVDLAVAAAAIDPRSITTVIYTSGTTARPKGVELTHAGVAAAVAGWSGSHDYDAVQRIISWLPTAHVMDRVLHYSMALVKGYETTTCPDPREIATYLTAVRPDLFIAVPRVWEKLKAGVEAAVAAQPPERREAAQAAIGAGLQRVRLREAGTPVPPELDAALERADAALFAGLRERLGIDRLTMAGTGSAPISRDVIEFFRAIGVELLQGYAMSESGCLGAVGRTGDTSIGDVGRPHHNLEVRLADDNEILMRGPSVMAGYRGNAEATREAIDADGWLHSGDIGTLVDGVLTIVDRKKELIITSGGKNISPAKVESELKAASGAVAHACAVGDRRPYVTALLVLEPGADAAGVSAAVAAANERLARVEQVKRYTILDAEWRPGGAELTPTQKLKRRSVLERYAAEIDAMYAGA
jgi:long-subunit acyl-CoA synthetase (AMP-forming)